jgi:integrase
VEHLTMRQKLTELSVARLKPPKTGRLEVWDSILPAFGLRIMPTGAKSYVVALRRAGTRHPSRIKLGEPPAMALADASAKARELMADPGTLAERERARADTVETVAEDFIQRHVLANRRARSANEAAAQLRREFVAPYRDQPITTIGRREILAALDRVTDRGHGIAANRLLGNLRKFFGWCVERGIVEASPVAGMKRPAKERSRDLDDAELAAIWGACDAMSYPFGPFVKLLIVTAQRRNEVTHMAWHDLDLDRRLWTLPAALTKADRVHEVALLDLALEIIAALPRLGNRWLFPANRVRSVNPISGYSKAKGKLDRLSGVESWRFHDLRRTAASSIARLGHPPHVVASVLNHSPGASQGITAVYDRYRYTDEKCAALDAWGREVERIIGRGEAKVIALR